MYWNDTSKAWSGQSHEGCEAGWPKLFVYTSCAVLSCLVLASLSMGILQARILEWVVMPSRGYSLPRNRTRVFYIADRFFTMWATREAHIYLQFSHLFPINNRKSSRESIQLASFVGPFQSSPIHLCKQETKATVFAKLIGVCPKMPLSLCSVLSVLFLKAFSPDLILFPYSALLIHPLFF